MYNNVAVIIPALERNRYSRDGDLVEFGELTLLEWKFIQLRNIIPSSNIFVSTPSPKVEKITKAYDIRVIKRGGEPLDAKVLAGCLKKIKQEVILWAHVTSPFISSAHFASMMDKFLKMPQKKFDSLISVLKLEEFVIFKKGALNFKMTEITERTKIEPLYLITNGCFIARKKIMARYRNYFGIKPYLFEVGTLEAMEIKKASDLSIANDLISLFFKRGLEKGRQ